MADTAVGRRGRAGRRRALALIALASVAVLAATVARRQDDRFRTLARESLSTLSGEIDLPGLQAPVEVIRDRWGVPHIYAQNVGDLFMAQGFVMAQDRLWQMEMWRRAREGRMAEVLGARAVPADAQARLLRYRGPFDDREWTSYHPEGRRIFDAFAAGVNAFIDRRRDSLPVEFRLTGITPEPWTAETLVLRSASFSNASSELRLARDVARLGREQANELADPDPWDPLVVPEGLDVSLVDDDVVAGTRGARGAGRPDLVEPYRSWAAGGAPPVAYDEAGAIAGPAGSNNWVVSGRLSSTGKPVVVNDPHRSVTNPSLRYLVHLNAPGWNVIGAVEPPFVGVAIGHNDRLAWGLTIVGTDQEDVYVEELNPDDPNQVRWGDGWEPLRSVREEIAVKGEAPRTIEIKYSRHGPIFHEDLLRHRAYALRSALFEPGAASYLAGLRLDQAVDCRAFLDAAMYWKAPTENLICGDVDGNISWQASALTPDRQGGRWSGRLPVPGTGGYEWNGFRTDLPRELNPDRGFIATANNNIQPAGFAPPIMFKRAGGVEYSRIARVLEMVRPDRTYSLADHQRMQTDALHLRAREELALFRGWVSDVPDVERARRILTGWDAVFRRTSDAAALYSTWRSVSSGPERDPALDVATRQPLHEAALRQAIDTLTEEQGDDWSTWRWGRMHVREFPHELVRAFDLPTVERGGGSGTVAADGASFREILDVADWDRSLATNTPGQSGQPESPFYGNLLPLWADDVYFPLVFSRPRVEAEAAHRLVLR